MNSANEALPPKGAATESILARCDELGQCSDEPGRITRGFLSPAMEEATTRVAGWMERAGLDIEVDTVGNLIGTYACGHNDAPLLILGSHLDTVRDAGRYDGVLGVLLALAVVETLAGSSLPFDLEIVAFSDEEGLRYGAPFLGSQALIGALDPKLLARRDENGIAMDEAIRTWGGNPDAIACRYTDRRLLGYLEAHIEQGPVLEHQDQPLGILAAISGACWMHLRFSGRAGHAGTTPMALRRDPMPAAAEVVLAAERMALEDDRLVATVGTLQPSPGAANVIPGRVEFSLDMRHPDDNRLAAAVDHMLRFCQELAARRQLTFEHEVLNQQRGAAADPGLSDLLAAAVAATGTDAERLAIGAGHDAMILARLMPMTMLLIRSPGGISHHPDETVFPGDVEAAHAALCAFVRQLAEAEASSAWTPSDLVLPAEQTLPVDATTSWDHLE